MQVYVGCVGTVNSKKRHQIGNFDVLLIHSIGPNNGRLLSKGMFVPNLL